MKSRIGKNFCHGEFEMSTSVLDNQVYISLNSTRVIGNSESVFREFYFDRVLIIFAS